MYGLRSAKGVVTIAPDQETAEKWLGYKHKTVIGGIEEVLVMRAGNDWVPVGA